MKVEIFDNECMIRLIPVMQDTKAVLSDFEVNTWKDKLAEAYGTNRKSVLKCIRSLSLTGILTIFTYPVQVHRVKRLTRNKKILKHLTKFNTFSNAERQRFLDKQFKYL